MKNQKKYLCILVLVILIFVLLIINNYNYYSKEKFEYDSIVSIPSGSAGFFSSFFFISNHFIFCKKNNINFKINTDNWFYKKELGWTDYFEEVNLSYNKHNNKIKELHHIEIIENYEIIKYKKIIPELYKYNQTTKNKIEKKMKEINLLNKKYDSIYIRRGDKLVNESDLYDTNLYIELLMKKNPRCKTIFLQTDDYNTYIDLQNYNQKNNLKLEIITLCDENQKGMIVTSDYIEKMNSSERKNDVNKEYLNKNNIAKKTKPFDQMTPDEKYESFMELIIGIDIISNSNICVCDYQSNVSRFIKLFHKNSDNVYNIMSPDKDIDYNKQVCPSYSF